MSVSLHQPVLLRETLEALGVDARPDGRWLDATLGRAGHAMAILEKSAPHGTLVGVDRDADAIAESAVRLERFAGRFELRHANFAELADVAPPGSFDGVLMDLGVSSPQLDSAERGFSFQREGPLDMRMDRRQGLTAAEVVNRCGETELAGIFWKLGEERASRRIAKAIVAERRQRLFQTTTQLAALIERVCPRSGRKTHPATRVFQALRCHVNSEGCSLTSGLAAACALLKPLGRLVVITFQSLEARAVKDFGNERSRDYEFDGPVDVPELRRPRSPELRWIERKAVMPTPEEEATNPRARSAQLRALEKLG
ncbi:MAG: 16S rRNA (cytosine(1402)-N(4))-methyltransferase RsmH [Verrucomicrobia bacterium]|nr:16S rRNA (cytosine(1402)-N(4))-methyltransferase RsmH [Verrucomicrobiota bacterium]